MLLTHDIKIWVVVHVSHTFIVLIPCKNNPPRTRAKT